MTWSCWPTPPAAGPRRCARSRAGSARCRWRKAIPPISPRASPPSTNAPDAWRPMTPARGSVTLIGAVSPPGGDFSEPVTSHTKEIIADLLGAVQGTRRRASLSLGRLGHSFSGARPHRRRVVGQEVDPDWEKRRAEALALLAREAEAVAHRQPGRSRGTVAAPSAGHWGRRAHQGRRAAAKRAGRDRQLLPRRAKQYALLDLAITIYKRGEALIKLGVPVQRAVGIAATGPDAAHQGSLRQQPGRPAARLCRGSTRGIRSRAEPNTSRSEKASEREGICDTPPQCVAVCCSSVAPAWRSAIACRSRITAGSNRNGQVIRSADNEVLIQVFEGTDDLDLEQHLGAFSRRAGRDRALARNCSGGYSTALGVPARRPAAGAVESAARRSTARPSIPPPAPIRASSSRPASPPSTG